ncbi:MAG: hypothetical protein ABI164_07145, partial [Acidobacteriaceae bacterium]
IPRLEEFAWKQWKPNSMPDQLLSTCHSVEVKKLAQVHEEKVSVEQIVVRAEAHEDGRTLSRVDTDNMQLSE